MDQEAWVHWDYSPEEWALFDRMDWRMGRLVATWLLISLPIALVAALFFFFLGGPSVVGPTFALTLLAVFGVCWLVSVSNSSWGRVRHQARRKRGQPHRVTLSKDGVWLAGTHFPLNGEITTRVEEVTFISVRVFLEEVTMTSEPTVLHFRRAMAVTSSRGAAPETLHLLVPRGHEEEAARLMQRYHLEVIEPNKQWLERLNAPSEPR